jgi:SAM-dependent methyltransferase
MCRRSNLVKYLDLGFTPLADNFLSSDQLKHPETHYPLGVMVCVDCGLSQLNHIVPPEILFGTDYVYEMSITKAGREHFSTFGSSVAQRFKLTSKDLAIDIGSNVGILLDSFRNSGTRILGVDPAVTVAEIARNKGIETINEFFSIELAYRILRDYGQASVITGTNVFAHINNLDEVMKGVNLLLRKGGIFIFESPYFENLVRDLEYDTIYHEHLSYLSVKPLVNFFKMFGMEIFDIVESDLHGGSFRVFVSRIGDKPVSRKIAGYVTREDEISLHTLGNLTKFASRVEKNRRDLINLLHSLRADGKKIAGIGAPAKGMTLLNYCKIGTETLDFVTEKSTLKIGKFTPGMHIPILADAELVIKKIDYGLLLAWNFSDEIMNNLADFKEAGGKFIIPIPEPKIV